jgi:hypothetical protein
MGVTIMNILTPKQNERVELTSSAGLLRDTFVAADRAIVPSRNFVKLRVVHESTFLILFGNIRRRYGGAGVRHSPGHHTTDGIESAGSSGDRTIRPPIPTSRCPPVFQFRDCNSSKLTYFWRNIHGYQAKRRLK